MSSCDKSSGAYDALKSMVLKNTPLSRWIYLYTPSKLKNPLAKYFTEFGFHVSPKRLCLDHTADKNCRPLESIVEARQRVNDDNT